MSKDVITNITKNESELLKQEEERKVLAKEKTEEDKKVETLDAALCGKVVVITGASSGIGEHLAKRLALHKCKLVLLARREDLLKSICAECKKSTEAIAVACDVTVKEQVEDAMKAALDNFGTVDVWINNAGRGINKSVLDLTEDDVTQMMNANVLSALYGMQVAVKHFKTKSPPAGMVMNVSSVLGRISIPLRSAYSAAKHALNALTSSLRVDIAKEYPEIVVSLYSPGAVATDFGLSAIGGGSANRSGPAGQDVESVVDEMIKGIVEKKEDFYSRPVYQIAVIEHNKDVAQGDRVVVEGGIPALIQKANSSKV